MPEDIVALQALHSQELTSEILTPQEQIEEIPFTANGHPRQLAINRSPQPEQLLPDDFIVIHSAHGTTRVSRNGGGGRWEEAE